MHVLWSRLTAPFRRARLERQLDDEVAFHIRMLEEEFRKQGMTAKAAAEAARREFGGVEQMKENYRDRSGLPQLEMIVKDVRYAVRALRQSPGFTIAAALSLALGIGANTAIFTLFNTLMLRLLPVEKPHELVSLYKTGGWGRGFASYPLYLELRRRTDVFPGVLARSGAMDVRFSRNPQDRAEFISREFVSGNYFDVLGIRPAIGRLFTDEDNQTHMGHSIAVLSYDFWRSRFGLDPRVLGQRILVDERPFAVIGVTTPGFRGVEVEHHPDLWVPTAMNPYDITNPRMHWVWILARRRPELATSQIQAVADVVMQQHLASVYGDKPDTPMRRRAMEQKLDVRDAGIGLSLLRDQFGKPLVALLAAVGLVLLIACANVANLMLARGARLRKEIALRFALGATRQRVIRQWLFESLLLALLGSALGLLVASWGAHALVHFLPSESNASLDVAPDRVVLGFTAAVSIFSVLLFGLVPALRVTALDPATTMKEGGLRPSRQGLRKTLVVIQVALSVVLVAMAGLFVRSLGALRSVNLGFHNRNVSSFELDFPQMLKGNDKIQFRQRLLARIGALPGVLSVSDSAPGPYQSGFWNASIRVPGSERTATSPVDVALQGVGPRYFETIGAAVLRGREFDETVTENTRKVAIVNEAFVREFYRAGADPVGQIVSDEKNESVLIVGVVRDILHQGLRNKIEPTVYLPAAQAANANFEPQFLVRAGTPAGTLWASIRRELNSLNPEVILVRPRTLGQQIDDSIFLDRMTATVSGCLAGLALVLGAVGLYGVIAYSVAGRKIEIGIRMALGAEARGVTLAVLREALILVGLGVAIGIPLSLVAGRVGASLLFGIRPNDSATLALTVLVLFATGAAAALLPARRAARIDPMQALRHE